MTQSADLRKKVHVDIPALKTWAVAHKKALGIGAGVLLLAFFVMLVLMPKKGTLMYGMCRVFTELQLRFPETLRVVYVEQYPLSVRLEHTHIDSFGQLSMSMTECVFKYDEQYGMAIDTIERNRRPYDPAIVKQFNTSLGTIAHFPPDLTLPPTLPKDIKDLKHD